MKFNNVWFLSSGAYILYTLQQNMWFWAGIVGVLVIGKLIWDKE